MFDFILNQVDKSGLNFVVSKTPFSATISLKCSFAKRFQNSEPEKVSTESLKISRVKTEDTDVEISKFKNTIEDLEKEVDKQKNALDLKHKEVKDFTKSAEDQIGVLREELLKVKREKNKLGSRIKILEDEVELVSGESDNVKHANGDLITKVKNLQIELNIKKDETKASEKAAEDLVIKLEKEQKSMKYQCDQCEHESNSQKEMRTHLQMNHAMNKWTQEPNIVQFFEYSCFYCKKIIKSKEDLENHKPVCYTINDFAANPCDQCGAQCPEEEDLARHRTTYHGLGTWSPELSIELFWCDICPLTLKSIAELDAHIGCCHEE